MNKETMRKHYETTPKDILINILISSREEVEKLQSRNKERKQEIERLNNIINEIYTKALDTSITSLDLRDYIINNLGSDKE